MTLKTDKIAELKAEFPKLRSGSDETGYTDLTDEQYEATIESWANVILDKEAKAEAKAKAQEDAKVAKEAALAKLAALGLDLDDLKSLGF